MTVDEVIDDYMAEIRWGDQATEFEKHLVRANIEAFYRKLLRTGISPAAETFREEGRRAHAAGGNVADCPYHPYIGVLLPDYISPGENWVRGWREADRKMSDLNNNAVASCHI